jgi:isopenicillin-N epimerase
MNVDVASHWVLEPGLTFLNHGSFGACPRPVLDEQTALRARLESDPIRFMDAELPGLLDGARTRLASFLAANPADLVFVPNATSGINAVLRSLQPLVGPGDELLTTDHEYNATLNALAFVARGAGAHVVTARVPFPVSSPEQVVDAVLARVTPRTRLAMLSWITSATALIFPVEQLATELASRGVEVLVDAAHVPGMLPIDLAALEHAGVTYLTGNLHKWLSSPKGAGFLWVRHDQQARIRPLVISHGANAPLRPGGPTRFQLEFDWPGTTDPTAVLALPAAIDFMAGLERGGWPAVMSANHALALQGRAIIEEALEHGPEARLAPDAMLGAMVTLALPADLPPAARPPAPGADPDQTVPDDPLHDDLLTRDRIQVPVFAWPARPSLGPAGRYLRISAQRYNEPDDYRRLADALRARRRA